ncbi:diaminopimelate decarboxylase [Paraburkholderia sp. BL23I1N1]|nr:diaminopimelate decarboxylase [Paraburkholderia sp. BL23I1N1]
MTQMPDPTLLQAKRSDCGEVDEADVLQPLLDPAISSLVFDSQGTLLKLVGQYGSPLNIVWPDMLRRNVEAFRAVLNRHNVQSEIYYGAKVNKSLGLVRAAVEAAIGVDVSSIYEMRDALRARIEPARLCATGPAKTRVFHAALIANGALIAVDSVEEFNDLDALVREIGLDRPTRVLLRYRPATCATSRFGMGADDLLACLRRLTGLKNRFLFEGFHFHLGGYGHESRVQAVRELTRFVVAARDMSLAPTILDIGGGLPVQYIDSEAYEAFLRAQHSSDYRNGKVPASFYPYGGPVGACEWLDRFLQAPCADGLSVARYLDAMQLTLAIEPGRSLADQTAISVFRITRVKSLAADQVVIFAEGSSFSACETWFASEFLVDPILVPAQVDSEDDGRPVRAWIAGHSCLDEDVITNRLIHFQRRPKTGDLLVYANAAGYQMDMLENEFHRHPMPRRISVVYNAAGGMQISPDDRMEYRNDFE